LDYLKRFDETALYYKTGFILEYLDELSPPRDFLNKIKKKVSKKVYYLDKDKASKFNGKWNLMIPKNFEELTRFV